MRASGGRGRKARCSPREETLASAPPVCRRTRLEITVAQQADGLRIMLTSYQFTLVSSEDSSPPGGRDGL
ncbi:hypothetical protein RRG08_029301 [Elysia crispata]|uniref:Uncharacterized protein n=1 Tax=Elysia crispata TaxID=231223 RepID=A0AAE1A626_9GAST|nr:hypothetical protein RRG08_029301 [Elysia crispata]